MLSVLGKVKKYAWAWAWIIWIARESTFLIGLQSEHDHIPHMGTVTSITRGLGLGSASPFSRPSPSFFSSTLRIVNDASLPRGEGTGHVRVRIGAAASPAAHLPSTWTASVRVRGLGWVGARGWGRPGSTDGG